MSGDFVLKDEENISMERRANFGTIMHRFYEMLIKNKNVSEKEIKWILEEYKEPEERFLVIQKPLENFKISNIY